MKHKQRKILIIIITIFILLLGASYGVGNYFINYALTNDSTSGDRNVEATIETSDEITKQIIAQEEKEATLVADYEAQYPFQDTYITSTDGLQLQALYQVNNEDHQWVILCHGYKSNNENMKSYAYYYAQENYNIVMPNNRAHGSSEGTYIGMGWLDKDDILQWIDWIVTQDTQAQIILHGVSMGAATVMNVAGENPANVITVIEDCGYTSVWDIFTSELQARFSLPSFPILNITNVLANIKVGYDFKEASSLLQIQKTTIPILFIHGSADDFVPVDMVYTLYDATTSEKDLYIVEGAGHAEANLVDAETYWNKVFTFIESVK